MHTARQGIENMEMRARAGRGKQAGFAASAELAPVFIPRQIGWSEETMELTLPPGRHETIEKQDPAGHVYWHRMAALVQRDCPPSLALRILR